MKDTKLYFDVKNRLEEYKKLHADLNGISNPTSEHVFIKQLIDSYKRVKYIQLLCTREISNERKNPHSPIYDPIRASILFYRENNINEAIWNIFLYVHFGKNLKTEFALQKAVYGKLNTLPLWTWDNVTTNLPAFYRWLDVSINEIKREGNFGNHRKYQSLKVESNKSTFFTIESFIQLTNGNFEAYINSIPKKIKSDKYLYFDYLTRHFNNIMGFGRLAVFDFLCMIGKIGILNIEPSSPYLGNGGPINGTKLLFEVNDTKSTLNEYLENLGNIAFHDYPFKMQILEDCVCNWQKSPTIYKLFKG